MEFSKPVNVFHIKLANLVREQIAQEYRVANSFRS